jgi:hypothetical protein
LDPPARVQRFSIGVDDFNAKYIVGGFPGKAIQVVAEAFELDGEVDKLGWLRLIGAADGDCREYVISC